MVVPRGFTGCKSYTRPHVSSRYLHFCVRIRKQNTRRNTLYYWPQMLVYVSVRNELVHQVETHLRNTDKLMTIPREEAVGKIRHGVEISNRLLGWPRPTTIIK